MDFQARMTELARTLDTAPTRALGLAESLEADLLAARRVDPMQLGWARDYRIRCLYRLGRHGEGLSVLTTPPPQPMTMTTKNAAWLHSVGAEMAVLAGSPPQALTLIGKALELRLADADAAGIKMAVHTGFALLRQADAPALIEAWYAEVEARAVAAVPGNTAAVLSDALAEIAACAWYQALPAAARRRDERALYAAASDGDAAEVARLLAAGVTPNFRNPEFTGLPTPLIAASFRGHTAVAFALITAGADVAAVNIQGRTALHLAADQDHADTVALLCQSGAPLAARDFVAHTALHLAAWQDHLASLHALLRAGAPLESRDTNGDTALALAATEPVPEVIRALLAAGAAIEAANDHGQTPLLRAAMDGMPEIVAILLAAGAKKTHRDHNRRTALEWARAEDHTEVIALLESPSRRGKSPR
jgi:ankyrin repeat protein